MNKENEVYVFGHKNPDTDSVAAAISLANLKRELGLNAIPKVLGTINDETKYAINYFNIKKPDYLNNVKLQIKDINYQKNYFINNKESIFNAYKYMMENQISNVPVINDNQIFQGTISMKDIIKDLLEENNNTLNTSYNNIINTIEAKEILKYDEEINGTLLVAALKSTTFLENVKLDENTILMVGDRHSIIEYAVNSKIKMLILTGNSEIKPEHLEIAKENKINIIRTKKLTYEVSRTVLISNYVETITNSSNIICVKEDDTMTDFMAIANKSKYSHYPVINNSNKCQGSIKLANTSDNKKKQVILVDHNEYEQSVDGLDEAEILEIVDHHNIGSVGTSQPINFRNMPVGSDNTIIYLLYKENNVEIPKNIAGLMLSGIISDTLLFASPTTTELDKTTAQALSKIAEVDLETYGMEMLKAGSSIEGKKPKDIIFTDFKAYEVGNKKICISQTSTFDANVFNPNINEYIDIINENAKNNDYNVFIFLITDILKNGSYLYYNESAKEIVENAFNIKNIQQGYYLEGCVSRKKQVVPQVLKVLE